MKVSNRKRNPSNQHSNPKMHFPNPKKVPTGSQHILHDIPAIFPNFLHQLTNPDLSSSDPAPRFIIMTSISLRRCRRIKFDATFYQHFICPFLSSSHLLSENIANKNRNDSKAQKSLENVKKKKISHLPRPHRICLNPPL